MCHSAGQSCPSYRVNNSGFTSRVLIPRPGLSGRVTAHRKGARGIYHASSTNRRCSCWPQFERHGWGQHVSFPNHGYRARRRDQQYLPQGRSSLYRNTCLRIVTWTCWYVAGRCNRNRPLSGFRLRTPSKQVWSVGCPSRQDQRQTGLRDYGGNTYRTSRQRKKIQPAELSPKSGRIKARRSAIRLVTISALTISRGAGQVS